jgi:hypothetical protein
MANAEERGINISRYRDVVSIMEFELSYTRRAGERNPPAYISALAFPKFSLYPALFATILRAFQNGVSDREQMLAAGLAPSLGAIHSGRLKCVGSAVDGA